ncbi:BREX system P-loop protein BrxC [uncultured Sulfurimonas sp.]|jgi:hypothetical protein|uniref:BREX system P-loop protein BrxC n=3 Tax=Sulfurimonas TaxID=202746 RepID=UPI0032B0FACD
MINNLFRKDIHRTIEGVVKADNLSDEAVFQEVDEYVITNELQSKFDEFFDVYSSSIGKPTESVGVWISGFFGSGKSHLLKVLSYILSSRRLESDVIGELFLEKVEDTILKANIKKAISIKTDTILFNIDQKTDSGANSRTDDAILNVFMKVFNEMRGYYPKQGYIAAFEKKLDADKLYDDFKAKFQSHSGTSWEVGREQFEWEVDNIAKAISEVRSISYESAQQQVEKLDANYSISVEDFANEVKAFVDTQDKDYRLIFMVDEVGQYIGDNSRLMLNLQTIVETLATKCKGSAWVVVTSQSAVAELVDTNKLTETDFSKILGRFKVKLNLTSQNAKEVIQKRILDKKEEYKPDLQSLYTKHQNSLTSIIYFSERGRQFVGYKDTDDFVLTYPFVPYQLELIQLCMKSLSKNETFQGRHQSVGERSMLDITQSVAKTISDKNIGTLASFDYFYDGIANIILPEAKNLMTTATNSLDEFSLKVLKVLFMIKYVHEFNPTVDHLTTLLVDELEINISDLKDKIKKSLNKLQNEVYIQKVGDNYEFLTDKEKDIENEIKAVSIDERDLNKELADWIYDNSIGISKFRYQTNKQDYPFTRKMDGVKVKGKDEELSLNILTPLGESYDDAKLTHKSFADSDLIISLKGDYDFEKELRIYVQTKKYIPQKNSGNLSSSERQIIIQKSEDNNTRRKDLANKLKEMFDEATIYFNGSQLNIKSSEPKAIVESAFNEIIDSFYTNLSMLKEDYTEAMIKTILASDDDLLSGTLDGANEAETTMLSSIKRMSNEYQTISVTKMQEMFSIKPYGWHQAAIMCLIASLYNKKLIDITEGGTPLNRTDVHAGLTNNRKFSTTIVKQATILDDKILKSAKSILTDLLPEGSFSSNSAREIYQNASEALTKLIEELENYKKLPFVFTASFEMPIERLKAVNVEFDPFFETLVKHEDDLLDMKDDVLDNILEFMRGPQRKIYETIVEFVKLNSANLFHINDENKNNIFALVQDKEPFKGRKVQKANDSLKEIQSQLEVIVEKSRVEATKKIENIITQLQEDKNFTAVEASQRNLVIRPLQTMNETIANSKDIDFINQRASDGNISTLYTKGLEKIEELMPRTKENTPTETVARVSFSSIKPRNISKLESDEDVTAYIKVLEENLRKQIEDGKQIIL